MTEKQIVVKRTITITSVMDWNDGKAYGNMSIEDAAEYERNLTMEEKIEFFIASLESEEGPDRFDFSEIVTIQDKDLGETNSE